jgi:hypothetical protein
MTVEELIAKLQKAPQGAKVWLEAWNSAGDLAEAEPQSIVMNFEQTEITISSGTEEDGTTGSFL